MSNSKKNELSNEIESLNLNDLDIEELEHRLELAAAGTPGLIDSGCTGDGGSCGTYTDTCVGYASCGNLCVGYVNACYIDLFLTGGNTI
jgi:hypothetical protein